MPTSFLKDKRSTLCACLPCLRSTNFPKGTDQARRLERFVRYYFERFDKLKQPSFHPKWRDVNLAAKVQGWNRYWLAADKLAVNGEGRKPQ